MSDVDFNPAADSLLAAELPSSDRALAPPRLGVVLVGGGRSGASPVVEPWIARLESLGVDYRIVTIDDSLPGVWGHRVSARLTQVGGGDWTTVEAWGRGYDFLTNQAERSSVASFDLWVFSCETWCSECPDFLEFLNQSSLGLIRGRRAAVGPIRGSDTLLETFGLGYRNWLDGPFLITDAALKELGGIYYPLATSRLLSGDAWNFLDDAPVSPALQGFLVEEAEALALQEADFEGFARATLNQVSVHLFSARLQSLGIAAVDWRFLCDPDLGPCFAGEAWSEQRRGQVAWQHWHEESDLRASWCLEKVELPGQLIHGEESRMRVSGWLRGPAAPYRVEVSSDARKLPSGVRKMVSEADAMRRDLLTAGSPMALARCGFDLYRSLASFPPGLHRMVLEVPALGFKRHLGDVEIAPRWQIEVQTAWPETAAEHGFCALGLEAEITSSAAIESVTATWNGVTLCERSGTDAPPIATRTKNDSDAAWYRLESLTKASSGLFRYLMRARFHVQVAPEQPTQDLALAFRGRDEESGLSVVLGTWRHEAPIEIAKRASLGWSIRRFRPWIRETGATEIQLAGWCLSEVSSLRLHVGDDILEIPLDSQGDPSSPEEIGIRHFELCQPVLRPPGPVECSLELIRGDEVTAESRWVDTVVTEDPVAYVEHLRLRAPSWHGDECLCFLSGWVSACRGAFDLAEGVRVRVDGVDVGSLRLEPDAQEFEPSSDPLEQAHKFCGELAFSSQSGVKQLELIATCNGEPVIVWRHDAALAPKSSSRLD